MPAEAPAIACCHNGSGPSVLSSATGAAGEMLADEDLLFRWRKAKVTVSFVPNQAALPPVSRISVPNWPFQNPRKP